MAPNISSLELEKDGSLYRCAGSADYLFHSLLRNQPLEDVEVTAVSISTSKLLRRHRHDIGHLFLGRSLLLSIQICMLHSNMLKLFKRRVLKW